MFAALSIHTSWFDGCYCLSIPQVGRRSVEKRRRGIKTHGNGKISAVARGMKSVMGEHTTARRTRRGKDKVNGEGKLHSKIVDGELEKTGEQDVKKRPRNPAHTGDMMRKRSC
eukprot:TRINITY_DN31854_c0_g1_i1.p3 TRINITY_DN31854_c0_g1~~TRINITY_DN31854_c0_g1_i1.p3  ORF type:complete len:113 (+),score=20.59 TRINITY_DN31854_c0_g1_i1:64-402(+)